MTALREAAQQALEALESVEWYGAGSGWMVDAGAVEKSITALKAALAEPDTPPQRLTNEEIRRIDASTHFHESPDWSLRFARAIEAAYARTTD